MMMCSARQRMMCSEGYIIMQLTLVLEVQCVMTAVIGSELLQLCARCVLVYSRERHIHRS